MYNKLFTIIIFTLSFLLLVLNSFVSASPTEENLIEGSYKYIIVCPSDYINIRIGPGTNYSKDSKGQLFTGDSLYIIKEVDGWVQFRSTPDDVGWTGWVLKRLVVNNNTEVILPLAKVVRQKRWINDIKQGDSIFLLGLSYSPRNFTDSDMKKDYNNPIHLFAFETKYFRNNYGIGFGSELGIWTFKTRREDDSYDLSQVGGHVDGLINYKMPVGKSSSILFVGLGVVYQSTTIQQNWNEIQGVTYFREDKGNSYGIEYLLGGQLIFLESYGLYLEYRRLSTEAGKNKGDFPLGTGGIEFGININSDIIFRITGQALINLTN